MSSPTSAGAANAVAAQIQATAAEHLASGLKYEKAGACDRAMLAYRSALHAMPSPSEAAHAHLRVARVHRAQAEWDDARRESHEAVRLAEAAGDDDLAAEAMNVEVGVHQLRGEFFAGHALAERAIARAGAPRTRGILLQNRGAMAARAGDFADAEAFFASSVEAFREADYDLGLAMALTNGSAAACDAGDASRALDLALEARAIAARVDSLDVLILALQNQAQALVELDRLDEAECMLDETLGHFATSGDVLRQAECLEILGSLHARRPAFHESARRCYERAGTLADLVGDGLLAARVRDRLGALGEPPAHDT